MPISDPHSPNGISELLPKSDRPAAKAIWVQYVSDWKDAYKNGTAYPTPPTF